MQRTQQPAAAAQTLCDGRNRFSNRFSNSPTRPDSAEEKQVAMVAMKTSGGQTHAF